MRVEDGAHRRLGPHRSVGVPVLADIAGVAGFAPHYDDLGIVADAPVVGMDEDLAELARERLVTGDVEFLVAEEHDAMLVERIADFTDRALVEILGDIDAEYFRTTRA